LFRSSRVSTIMDLYKREKVNNEAMEILRKDIDRNLFDLIVSYIKNTLDPGFELSSQKNIWSKLDDF
ncbi:MAG: hypothetical protein ACFFD4_26180, partial [Candidatus Odinarchaeota archaeon]